MGVYLNPGATSFRQARNTELYVDKSELIAYLNRVVNAPQRFVCVSRPRRFGKTMAADMVCAYYDCNADGASEFTVSCARSRGSATSSAVASTF